MQAFGHADTYARRGLSSVVMGPRFHLRTFGCQMNQHDAGRIANLLYHEGFRATDELEAADLVLIHTCSIRDKAEQKLYSELGALSPLKARSAGLIIGVGGCVAQQEGDRLLTRFPHLDFVFGPQNIPHLPSMIGAARARERQPIFRQKEAADIEENGLMTPLPGCFIIHCLPPSPTQSASSSV